MNTDKKELAVAALANGTVIDHIPAENLFKAVSLLHLDKCRTRMTIGNNLPSGLPEATINRIALIAPHARVNTIRDFEVVEKRQVELPDMIVGIVRCANPKCITNHEPMATRFDVVDRDNVTLRCCYCGQSVGAREASIIE